MSQRLSKNLIKMDFLLFYKSRPVWSTIRPQGVTFWHSPWGVKLVLSNIVTLIAPPRNRIYRPGLTKKLWFWFLKSPFWSDFDFRKIKIKWFWLILIFEITKMFDFDWFWFLIFGDPMILIDFDFGKMKNHTTPDPY